jgi:hypothetical protein
MFHNRRVIEKILEPFGAANIFVELPPRLLMIIVVMARQR